MDSLSRESVDENSFDFDDFLGELASSSESEESDDPTCPTKNVNGSVKGSTLYDSNRLINKPRKRKKTKLKSPSGNTKGLSSQNLSEPINYGASSSSGGNRQSSSDEREIQRITKEIAKILPPTELFKEDEGQFRCFICLKIIRCKGSFSGHLMDVHFYRLRCWYCHRVFQSKSDLARHTKSCKAEKSKAHESRAKDKQQKTKPIKRRSTPLPLDQNIQKVADRIEKILPPLTKFKVNENKYRCFICSSIFTAASSLREHLMTVHFHRRYQCPECSQLFSSKSYRFRHVIRCME